jgi:hypothetical protein
LLGVCSAVFLSAFTKLVPCFEVFLVARRAMRHMFPLLLALERPLLDGASCKIEQHGRTGTAFPIWIRIGRENGILKLILDAVPLLFWRFTHVKSQNIMACFRRSVLVFSVV